MALESNHIYQYSLLNALMAGVSSSGIPVSTLLTKGNQGLGTFVLMNGELLLLDGTCYQLLAEGKIRIASPDDEVPYCAVTQFVPEHTFPHITLSQKSSIDSVLSDWNAHSKNLFISYRITGSFASIKCRTVKGQEYEGQPLSELGKSQFVAEYEDVRGTVIGFRSPEAWQGFSVAGEHMHFIDEKRRIGGHVLELRDGVVEMQVAVVGNVHVELPRSERFNEVNLKTDDEGLKKVEG
ncbi:Alpha-acetolactate decarboxylase [Lachnellula cervina]|uniref:Alpha-acetolactate decarboxylase n=1 Tax=Lachnellula cervina TaxID=1316786 RepID=A0A7D8UQC5_9HELO|nr:Alpha-acetolactate decarboxylase [Lachnellula cervina]